MGFDKGHKYYPHKSANLPDDPLDTIEAGLVKMMKSDVAAERLNAYKLYVSLLGKHPKKRTVLEPAIESLVKWLYTQAEASNQSVKRTIHSLVQTSIDNSQDDAGVRHPSSISSNNINGLAHV